jgi:uncharacterized tellurite resistance protein B-like protein
VNLGPARTLIPTGVASAIWYGSIIALGTVIGAEWERINSILLRVNRTLGIATVILIVIGLVGYLLRRQRRQRERVWHATRDALDPATPSFLKGSAIAEGSAQQAAALLVLELAYADSALTDADRELVSSHLRDRWGLDAHGAPAPDAEHVRRSRFEHYAARLRARFGRSQRLALVERMWTVAFSDGAIGIHEERLMHLAGELLGIGKQDLVDARERLRKTPVL